MKGGVFRSTDYGENWSAVNKGLTNQDVMVLTVSGNTLFAGTGLGGIYRSLNNGTNWTDVSIDKGLQNLQSITAIAMSGNTHYLLCSTVVYF